MAKSMAKSMSKFKAAPRKRRDQRSRSGGGNSNKMSGTPTLVERKDTEGNLLSRYILGNCTYCGTGGIAGLPCLFCSGKQTFRVLKMDNIYMHAGNVAIVCCRPTTHNDPLRPGFIFTDPTTQQRIEIVNYDEFEWDEMIEGIQKRNNDEDHKDDKDEPYPWEGGVTGEGFVGKVKPLIDSKRKE